MGTRGGGKWRGDPPTREKWGCGGKKNEEGNEKYEEKEIMSGKMKRNLKKGEAIKMDNGTSLEKEGIQWGAERKLF